MLEQHRRQLARELDKKLRLSKDVQAISKRLAQKRPKVAKATTEATRKSRQREVERLERDLLRVEDKVVGQDKLITNLRKKVAKEESSEAKKQERASDRRAKDQARREHSVDQDLKALAETTSALEVRLTQVEEASLGILAEAVQRDPVRREHDIFLSYATPDETTAGNLRDELEARGLSVWMADAQARLGESLVTSIDAGIGSSRCGICLVTPAYVDPDRFWPRQELAGLIMGRKRVIPIVSGLSFDNLQEFSALLGDRKGLDTETHGLDEIAGLLVDALSPDS